MRETIQQLIAIQEHDRKALRLSREAESIPRRKEQLHLSISDHQKAVVASEEAYKKGLAATHEIEVEVGVLRETIQRLQRQQFEVKNNDEYRILTSEIKAAEKRIRALEDRELEHMERSEELQARGEEQKAEFARQEADIRDETKALDERAEDITGERAVMAEQRKSLIAETDPEWLRRYERILAHVGDYALVPIENGTCGGCHMQLPPHVIQDARRAETISSCAYCGRLLYWR